jgi:hypothetical protein
VIGALALLGACHGVADPGPQPSITDPNWATAGPDAPWGMRVTTALWATGGDGVTAFLLLTDGPQNCDDLAGIMSPGFIGSMSGASGLYFVPTNRTGGGSSFEGLYLTGYGNTSGYDGGFTLDGGAFHDGVLWTLGYGGGMWLRVDDVGDDLVTGAYYASWWSGTFQAENCGVLSPTQQTYYRESGYGYGYYTGYYTETYRDSGEYGTYYY